MQKFSYFLPRDFFSYFYYFLMTVTTYRINLSLLDVDFCNVCVCVFRNWKSNLFDFICQIERQIIEIKLNPSLD